MKRVVKVILGATIVVGALVGGIKLGEAKQAKRDLEPVRIVNTTTRGDKYITDYSDGSWSIINDSLKEYIFHPVDLGDWEYNCKNQDELERVIATYLLHKNREVN